MIVLFVSLGRRLTFLHASWVGEETRRAKSTSTRDKSDRRGDTGRRRGWKQTQQQPELKVSCQMFSVKTSTASWNLLSFLGKWIFSTWFGFMVGFCTSRGLTCECLETQCRSTFRTLLVAALRMMNSLSQAFSELLKPGREKRKALTL